MSEMFRKWNSTLSGGLFDNANVSNSIGLNGVNTTPMGNFGGLSDFTGGGNSLNNVSGWNTFSNVLGGISGLANAFTGFKQLGLAKKQFNWQKDAFNTNLVNQANLVNSQLADRQNRRQFFDSNAMGADQYLARYGAASSVQEANERQQQNQNAWNRSKALNNVATGG